MQDNVRIVSQNMPTKEAMPQSKPPSQAPIVILMRHVIPEIQLIPLHVLLANKINIILSQETYAFSNVRVDPTITHP
jgi:hypothetical protein